MNKKNINYNSNVQTRITLKVVVPFNFGKSFYDYLPLRADNVVSVLRVTPRALFQSLTVSKAENKRFPALPLTLASLTDDGMKNLYSNFVTRLFIEY